MDTFFFPVGDLNYIRLFLPQTSLIRYGYANSKEPHEDVSLQAFNVYKLV